MDVEYENCGSTHLLKRKIETMNDLKKIEGRIYTLDKKGDDFYIATKKKTELLGKTIYLKTSITCCHPDPNSICKACHGFATANMNYGIHIGIVCAFILAEATQQALLSAKHLLATNSEAILVDDEEAFKTYFTFDGNKIKFLPDIISLEMDENSDSWWSHINSDEFLNHNYIEFNTKTMTKKKDGENNGHDRSIPEIVVWDEHSKTYSIIREKTGQRIFLTAQMSELYIEKMDEVMSGDIVRISIRDILTSFDSSYTNESGLDMQPLFELAYLNKELSKPVDELKKLIGTQSVVETYTDYSEYVERLDKLFMSGGVNAPLNYIEFIARELIRDNKMQRVDWRQKDPKFKFNSLERVILNGNEALTSIVYSNSSKQLNGDYGLFTKTDPSMLAYMFDHDNPDAEDLEKEALEYEDN